MAREQPGKQAANGDQRCSEYNFEEPIKFNLPAFRASQIAEQALGTHLCPAAVAVHVPPLCFGRRFPLDRPRALPQGAR
jgi:hypothetical protein